MQPPFRARDLLHSTRFISFCSERGVRTTREQLEFYDKHALVLPAVRISRPYVPYRKILISHEGRPQWRLIFADDLNEFSPLKVDPKTYYDFGAVTCSSDERLAQCEKDGMISYPARDKYQPWKEDLMVRRNELPTSLKALGEGFADFYSRSQCFTLKEVQSRMVLEVRDAALFMDDAAWQGVGRKLRQGAEGSIKYVQDAIISEYRLMQFMDGIRDVLDDISAEAGAAFAASLEDQRTMDPEDRARTSPAEFRREAGRDARSSVQLFEMETAPDRVRSTMAKCEYSIDDVRKARERVANQARELDPTFEWTEFTSQIPSELLARTRGHYRLVLDYYQIVEELGWALRMLGDQPPSLKKLLVGADAHRVCVICGTQFLRKRTTQVTCATKSCIRTHGNNLKRIQRRHP